MNKIQYTLSLRVSSQHEVLYVFSLHPHLPETRKAHVMKKTPKNNTNDAPKKIYISPPRSRKKTKKHHNNNNNSNNNNKAPTRFFPVNVNILQDTRSGSPWRKLMESRCDSIDGSMDVSASEVLKMSTKFKTDTLLSVKSTLARLLFLVSVCLFDSFFLSLFGFFRLSMRGSCRVDFWEIFRTFAQKPQAHCSKGFQQVPTQGNSGLDTKFMFSKGLEV